MDKTELVKAVANLFQLAGHRVQTSVRINHREIDVVAEELAGLLRKTVLIECADYAKPVGVEKLQADLLKLRAAAESMRDRAVLMHVSRVGYSPDASGYARDQGLAISTIDVLTAQLVNFDPYVASVKAEPMRAVIEAEYQPTRIHFDGRPAESRPAMEFLDTWLNGEQPWLTIIGDYGVGKSWTLKRYLYELVDRYCTEPTTAPLPFFIPLQRFAKAFDFQNLVLRTFQLYGLTGVHYPAFEYLARSRRIVFLLDSFDEMAQVLSREILRENLKELLSGASGCRAIMTSRPTYFESRAERLIIVQKGGVSEWHPLDAEELERQSATSRAITERLQDAQFARLNDLSSEQRKRLFRIVLGNNPAAHRRLSDLYTRFQELETISQRAVIARLLTTVAETLALGSEAKTVEGYPLLPDDLKTLNQAKIFEIVVYNLLQRDSGVGFLAAGERLVFLRHLAVFLQRKDREFFADNEALRSLVARVFERQLRRTDTPQQQLENYYRTCRRHSGLTTEAQFLDTSGNIDTPVDETDTDSRVGFSHNSLREYLVAEAFVDFVKNGTEYPDLPEAVVTDLVGDFVVDIAQYQAGLVDKIVCGIQVLLGTANSPEYL
jgi:GTPase SAR1 family protein